MIPILHATVDTENAGDILCRLYDCISCTVTEERNGIYECDFEYPVNGANYNEIYPGRIIEVTHDTTGYTEYFDIVSYSKPISGIVSFHATHISYRLSNHVIIANNISSPYVAFNIFNSSAIPASPFRIGGNGFTAGAWIPALNGEPKSIRSVLAGTEGSILDIYPGEYEFTRWDVMFRKERGTLTDVTVRYGLNMTDYKDDTDHSETYTAVVPYWKGTDENGADIFVIGDMTYRTQCPSVIVAKLGAVPLDVSDKFQEQPAKADVEAMALQILEETHPEVAQQNISVSFVQLAQTEEYKDIAPLLECNLCDYVKVEFERYNMSGDYKIVKTVFNVLLDRYDEMELGSLSTTLSQALNTK